MSRPSRYGASREDLAALLADQPRYRVDQVWSGLYEQLAGPEELTNLPKAVRALVETALPLELEVVTEQTGDKRRDGQVAVGPGRRHPRSRRC